MNSATSTKASSKLDVVNEDKASERLQDAHVAPIVDIDEEKNSSKDTKKQLKEFDTEEFPDGGFGWLVTIGAWFCMATTFGMVNSYAVYQSYYQTELYPKEDANKISLIGSLQPFIMYFAAIPTGYLFYYFGPRKSVALGCLIQTFALMMMSITNNVWQLFLAQGLLLGIGSGIVYLAAISILMQWFKRKRAFAVGLASTGSSLGGVYWPIMIRKLIDRLGVDWTNRILGFTYIPISLIIIFTLRPRLATESSALNFSVLKDVKFLVVLLSFGLTNFALFPGLFFIDLYGQRLANKLGHQLVDHDYLVAILNAGSFVGRLLPGILADKFGRINVLIPFLVVASVTPLALWLPSGNSNGLLMSFVVVWGIASGVMISLFPPVIPQLFGIKDNHSRLGFFFALGGIGTMIGPVICGTFIPNGSSNSIKGFNKIAIFVGVLLSAGTGVLILLRLRLGKLRDII